MEDVTVLIARAIAWVEVIDLNPTGKVFYPLLVEWLKGRYGFQIFPQKVEDYDENKGVKFSVGRFDETTIEQVTIYQHGITLDTRVNTGVSKQILEDALTSAAKELGLNYKGPSSIRSWQYYSQLVFVSHDLHLALLHPALQQLSERVSKEVEALSGEKLSYEPTNIHINHDPMGRKHPYGYLSIQRRENLGYPEGRYFSDAPLPSATHRTLLEEFEQALAKR